MLLSVRAESNQRRAKGAPSTNTWLTPVFIGVAPLDPHLRGYLTGVLALVSGGSEHKTMRPSCLGDTGPYCVKI